MTQFRASKSPATGPRTSRRQAPAQSGAAPIGDPRWAAVLVRDTARDGAFVFAVVTTGVYCRPSCPARRPLPANVRFFATGDAAERAGFRACQRCRPGEPSPAQRNAGHVASACRTIEAADTVPPLARLAAAAGLSPGHFQRIFKATTGVSPKAYAMAIRKARVMDALAVGTAVTAAAYAAGFASSGRFYATAGQELGMPPKAVRDGGRGETIRFATGRCWLGAILVAATQRGVCAILLGDSSTELKADLAARFANADLVADAGALGGNLAQAIAVIERPGSAHELPFDIRGTVFQHRVWQALRAIPAGETASYSEIAQAVGRPAAVRAVAGAIAANPVAVAVPCHRVVRADGGHSGYRWGVHRKKALLAREKKG